MSDDDFESDKKKILDEQNEDNSKTTVKFLNITDELKQLGVKQLGFRGALLYFECDGQCVVLEGEYWILYINGKRIGPVEKATATGG
jgi:hypothetical protein